MTPFVACGLDFEYKELSVKEKLVFVNHLLAGLGFVHDRFLVHG
jgi:hypothetical protein